MGQRKQLWSLDDMGVAFGLWIRIRTDIKDEEEQPNDGAAWASAPVKCSARDLTGIPLAAYLNCEFFAAFSLTPSLLLQFQ